MHRLKRLLKPEEMQSLGRLLSRGWKDWLCQYTDIYIYINIYIWFLYCNAEYLERTLMYVVQTYTATTIVLGKLATLTSSHLRKIVSSHISFPDFQPIPSRHSGAYWSRHAWCRWAMLCQILWAPSQSRPPLMEVPTPMLTRRPRVLQSYRLQCQIVDSLEPICKHSKPTRGIGQKRNRSSADLMWLIVGKPGGIVGLFVRWMLSWKVQHRNCEMRD